MTHEELVSLAWLDAPTGLLNRQGFDAAAADAFAEARRLGQPISALMCDIDNFRGLNDKYGREAGDIALRTVAQMLEESNRTSYRSTRATGRRRVRDALAGR